MFHCPDVLYREFLIALGVAEQEVGEVVAGEGAVKVEATLGLTEQILRLLVERPAKAEFQLVRALGPRQVVAELIVVGLFVHGQLEISNCVPVEPFRSMFGMRSRLFGPVKNRVFVAS